MILSASQLYVCVCLSVCVCMCACEVLVTRKQNSNCWGFKGVSVFFHEEKQILELNLHLALKTAILSCISRHLALTQQISWKTLIFKSWTGTMWHCLSAVRLAYTTMQILPGESIIQPISSVFLPVNCFWVAPVSLELLLVNISRYRQEAYCDCLVCKSQVGFIHFKLIQKLFLFSGWMKDTQSLVSGVNTHSQKSALHLYVTVSQFSFKILSL